MTEAPENIVLEYLRRFDRKLDSIADDMRDIKVRVTSVETGLAGVQRRIDRVEERLDRIERRLNLAEA
jgi:predicted  nucleic acid-binding Zn-ribbon protein